MSRLTKSPRLAADRLNVFVPLVDLTDERVGGTEMKRQSHFRAPSGSASSSFATYAQLESVVHRVTAGTPLAMDYRVWHRGLANASAAVVRPLLYFKYAAVAPSVDSVASSSKRQATDPKVPTKHKKRVVLTRVTT